MSSDIALGGGGGGPPSVIFRTPGQYVDVALCKIDVRPWVDFATKKVKLNDDGVERTQDVVTALCIGGTAVVRSGEQDAQVTPGEPVSLWIAGHRRWDFVQAQKTLGGAKVGDVMRVTYKGEEQGRGASPKKVWTFQMRRARPDEHAQTARCVEIHNGAPLLVASGPSHDDEPF